MNATYPCNLPPFISPQLGIPEAVNILQAAIAVIAALLSAPINIYLFIIIIKYPELHQRSLFLSIQIIGVEILYHLTVPAVILVSTVHGQWVLGEVACEIIGVINDGFAIFRFSMTFVLTIDRFLSVYKPFFYVKRGKLVSWSLSAVMWLLTIFRVGLPLVGILDCYAYVPTFKTCTIYPGCSEACKSFAAWSIAVIVTLGVILPLLLYAAIFYIIQKITNYHVKIQMSVYRKKEEELQAKKEVKLYTNMINNKKRFVTVSILLISIMGTAPAFTLYMASIFHTKPDRILLITNMLVGRTSFNIIPFFDAIAFSRHQDVKKVSMRIFRCFKSKTAPDNYGVKFQSSDEKNFSPYPRKSLTSVTTL